MSIDIDSEKEPGILYFSSIPKGINVSILREILSQFGEIGKVYLVPKKKTGKFREYEEGWVEFSSKKIAKKVAKSINCTEIPSTKRNPWYGSLWTVRFLPDTSWQDIIGIEREEEEQRRSAHDRDIIMAKRQSRQFSTALETDKHESRLKLIKGKRFNERKPININKRQKLTEDEIKDRLSRSNRTPPDGTLGSAAVSDKHFMSSLFTGGL